MGGCVLVGWMPCHGSDACVLNGDSVCLLLKPLCEQRLGFLVFDVDKLFASQSSARHGRGRCGLIPEFTIYCQRKISKPFGTCKVKTLSWSCTLFLWAQGSRVTFSSTDRLTFVAFRWKTKPQRQGIYIGSGATRGARKYPGDLR